MTERRILYLSPEHPDPEGNGGEVRLFNVLQQLARRGWAVTLIAPATVEKIERGSVLRADGVDLRSVRRPRSNAREAVEALLTEPRVARALVSRSWLAWQAEVYLRELRPVLDRALGERWDAAVIEHDWAVEWVRELPDGLPVGLVFQNVTDELLERQARTERRRVDRARARRDARLVRREMRGLATHFDRGFACSADDARTVERRWGLPTDVVPNGTHVAGLASIGHGDEVPGRIVFTGTMSYPPNAQAAAWFVTDVLPLIRELRPDVSLQIVGGGPPPEVEALAEAPGVEVTGRVERLDPFLAAAEVAVAPLLSGGGTKLKVLEALAAGRALVVTTVGAEGIEVVDGEHLRVADEPRAFADAVIGLLADRDAAIGLGERGRARVAERYDWAAIGGRMDSALRDWLRV